MKTEHNKIFCGPSKILKNMTYQYIPKIFRDPHKNPQAPSPPTYLMHGPLGSWLNFSNSFRTIIV